MTTLLLLFNNHNHMPELWSCQSLGSYSEVQNLPWIQLRGTTLTRGICCTRSKWPDCVPFKLLSFAVLRTPGSKQKASVSRYNTSRCKWENIPAQNSSKLTWDSLAVLHTYIYTQANQNGLLGRRWTFVPGVFHFMLISQVYTYLNINRGRVFCPSQLAS